MINTVEVVKSAGFKREINSSRNYSDIIFLKTKRCFDIILSLLLLFFMIFATIPIAICIIITSPGPILFWSERVGKDNVLFQMPKFRTMYINTPIVSTSKIPNPKKCLTPVGGFMRKCSLDELPQLFSILKGDMSFIGPRPVLSTICGDQELIDIRTKYGIHKLTPGLSGWQQVNGRDNLTMVEKAAFDLEYVNKQSFWFDAKIFFFSVLHFVVIADRDKISH